MQVSGRGGVLGCQLLVPVLIRHEDEVVTGPFEPVVAGDVAESRQLGGVGNANDAGLLGKGAGGRVLGGVD